MNGTLLDLLRGGGLILYSRHAKATVGQDEPFLSFEDCSTQRNLSSYGRRQAMYYGETLRRLQIPVHYPVIASPFCRAIDTAVLAFGPDKIEIDPFWFNVYLLSTRPPFSEQNRILYDIASILETVSHVGTNTVIIAHSFPDRVGLGAIPDMGTVIVRPHGLRNGYEVIGLLSLDDLSGL